MGKVLKAHIAKRKFKKAIKNDEWDIDLREYSEMDDEAKKKKQQDIFELEADIQKFRQNAAQLAQLKQDELMKPLYKKVGDAVSVIAKEEKYTQIFTLDGNELAYVEPLFDLTLKVAQKLGISID